MYSLSERTLMNVTFICPQCERTTRSEILLESSLLACTCCQHQQPMVANALETDSDPSRSKLNRCLICGNTELFIRKDFSQRLGLLIIIIGFTASSIAWYNYWTYTTYLILFGTALLDLLLYSLVGSLLQCYRCHSQSRGLATENHQIFDLEVHERHRQQTARLAELSVATDKLSGSVTGDHVNIPVANGPEKT